MAPRHINYFNITTSKPLIQLGECTEYPNCDSIDILPVFLCFGTLAIISQNEQLITVSYICSSCVVHLLSLMLPGSQPADLLPFYLHFKVVKSGTRLLIAIICFFFHLH